LLIRIIKNQQKR